jgi:alpha-1,3-rhamnosyl/mannosyltransferase
MPQPDSRRSVVNVLVDGRPVRAKMTGVARIITALVEHMKRDGRLRFHILGVRGSAAHWRDQAGLSFVQAGSRIGPSAGRRLIFEQHGLRRIIAQLRPDVYWATWDYGVPWRSPCPTVLTVHDLIPLRHAAGRWTWDAVAYKLSVRLSIDGASAIVTDSEATRAELVERYRVRHDRTTVIPPGIGQEFQPDPDPADQQFGDGPFALYVGGYAPRKNFHSLLLAIESLLQSNRLGALRLVATGSEAKLDEESRAVYARLKPHGVVRFAGNVPNEVLPSLYRQARVFIFPSLAEGFGFPPLEAMASGVPVICGQSDSLPEVVGSAAHFVDVRSPQEIAAAIARIVESPSYAEQLRSAGLDQAAKFRWSGSAARMATVLLETAHRRRN